MLYIKGIYAILNSSSNDIYVGKSVNLKNRKSSHFSSLRRNIHYNKHLQNSFNKYGEKSFEFIIIEENNLFSDDELVSLEVFYIDYFDSFKNGFNQTLGGEGMSGRKMPIEERLLRSEMYSGINNPFYGKNHSDETRELLSLNASEKVGDKNPFYGKTHSVSWKEDRNKLYKNKIKDGWIDPKKGVKKDKEAVEKMKKNMSTRKPVSVDGIVYDSLSECAKHLGIHRKTLRDRLENEKLTNYIYIDKELNA